MLLVKKRLFQLLWYQQFNALKNAAFQFYFWEKKGIFSIICLF